MKLTKAVKECVPCVVLRDVREVGKPKAWDFPSSSFCAGVSDVTLMTGDYTIRGFEEYVSIERKGDVNDFVNSMATKRFKEELSRMSDVAHAFVVLEFPMEDLENWPMSSGKNPWIQKKLPFQTRGAATSAYLELKLGYPYVDFTFAGSCGRKLAGSIFRRVVEAYAKEVIKKNATI